MINTPNPFRRGFDNSTLSFQLALDRIIFARRFLFFRGMDFRRCICENTNAVMQVDRSPNRQGEINKCEYG